jgi:glycosyltransferase involved in cell wall biosynthesis
MPADRPARVAYVIGELGKGGAELQLFHLLRHLDRARFAPQVFVLSAGGYWAEPIRAFGIPVVELPRRRGADVSRLRRLRGALRACAPDVLQTIRWSGNTYGRLAAAGLGIPRIVASERVLVLERSRWQVRLERLLDRMTHAHLVNCSAIADGLVAREHIARAKIHVIPNGIDVREHAWTLDRAGARAAAGLPAARPIVAQIGRLTPQKDYPTFLRAAALVAAARPDVDFLVVGDGPERVPLEALVRTLGLAARCRFTGLRHDVAAILGCVDVLALASTFEGFPNVILEAMASGAVVVATAVGGSPELVESSETGVLVPPRDPAAMAEAILRVLDRPAWAGRLARAARHMVETTFTVEALATRTMRLYAVLVDGTRSREAA